MELTPVTIAVLLGIGIIIAVLQNINRNTKDK